MLTTHDAGGYLAKLKRGGRPAVVLAAFLALFDAVQRLMHDAGQPVDLQTPVWLLARAISRYVAAQLGTPAPDVATIAADLQARILGYASRATSAVASTAPGAPLAAALAERAALIAIAETQRATAEATAAAVPDGAVIVRATHGAAPCDECARLAGRYPAPYPADLYWTHPRCACSWQAEGA